jgi:hypothetical protein
VTFLKESRQKNFRTLRQSGNEPGRSGGSVSLPYVGDPGTQNKFGGKQV